MSVEFIGNDEKIKSELLTVNMGPQHPATHGVLRVEIKTDSEIVAEAIPHIGYLHRCMEKHCENADYRAIVPFVDRMDYLASMNMELGYAITIEKLANIAVPRRAEVIRVLVSELQRIASHLVAFGTYGIDVGAFTPFLYAFDQREKILSFFESISGGRLLYNYISIGGVSRDVSNDLIVGLEKFCAGFEDQLKMYDTLLTQNKIFIERTANVGVMDKDYCYDYGITGPVLRGAGVEWDLRKKRPYSIYNEFNFEVAVGKGLKGCVGDCWDRYYVRMVEMEQSVKIIKQALVKLREEGGEFTTKVPRVIKVPVGEIYMRTECPKGELGYHIISDGKKGPYRFKVKSPCFTNVSALGEIAPGMMIADLVATIGSLDIVLGEVDR